MALPSSSITSVGWAVLSRLDENSKCPFSLISLEEAILNGTVMELLKKLDDENGFIAMAIKIGGDDLGAAMTDAGEALRGQWERKTGVSKNVNACVMAMVLEAIQQWSHKSS